MALSLYFTDSVLYEAETFLSYKSTCCPTWSLGLKLNYDRKEDDFAFFNLFYPPSGITLLPPSQVSDTDSSNSKRRTGSLALFFRKFYYLAHLRLDLLCHTLEIAEEDVKRKIWTVFEHSIRNHTSLMKDRHLDQLLMCSLYIVCKVFYCYFVF
jgi:hypothetical protein